MNERYKAHAYIEKPRYIVCGPGTNCSEVSGTQYKLELLWLLPNLYNGLVVALENLTDLLSIANFYSKILLKEECRNMQTQNNGNCLLENQPLHFKQTKCQH